MLQVNDFSAFSKERTVFMKKFLISGAITLATVFGLVPIINALTDSPSEIKGKETIELTLEETGEKLILSPEEYIKGCLTAQIPIDYEKEALFAQASAAYTYALRLIEDGKALTDSPSTCQPYFTEAQAREYYGEDYERFLPIVEQAAAFGAKNIITYDEKPIYSTFHSISTGRTNRPEYVWGVDFPYLSPVESPWDETHVNYAAVNEISTEQMRAYLMRYDKSLVMPVDYNMWFTHANVDEWGYTLSIDVGGRTLSGGDVWRLLKLRSTAFSISYNGDVFVVETKGHGHGVGLSQYGAQCMAKSGKTAEEILEYYYKGAQLTKI